MPRPDLANPYEFRLGSYYFMEDQSSWLPSPFTSLIVIP
jgi:hypothetical protein